MKAIVYRRYGSPDVLRLEETPMPSPQADEVLVRVRATSVNAADVDLLRGAFMIRPGGVFRPKYRILGSDVSGTVEATGANATRFAMGAEVYGDLTESGFGAFAEYVCVPERALAPKPSRLTFKQAAAVPAAGGVAWRNLSAKRPIRPGHRVLINGAGGGMGTFAVQIAKAFGAEVTGVDKAGKLDMLRSIGADHVIDYMHKDFTRTGEVYDLILDLAAERSLSSYRRALRDDGVYLMVGGTMRALLQAVFLGPSLSRNGDKSLGLLLEYPTSDDLIRLNDLLEDGRVSPVIDRTYALQETAAAFCRLESGEALGKVVIAV